MWVGVWRKHLKDDRGKKEGREGVAVGRPSVSAEVEPLLGLGWRSLPGRGGESQAGRVGWPLLRTRSSPFTLLSVTRHCGAGSDGRGHHRVREP